MIDDRSFEIIHVDSFFPGIQPMNNKSRKVIKRYNKSLLNNYKVLEQYGSNILYIPQ